MWHFFDESIFIHNFRKMENTSKSQNNHHPIVDSFFRSDGSS